ncbi:MAG TPA: hydantoinase/oxoprolinase family protein [Acidimicrobiales bacterium]|nr:hydantoinase/oxoprolinase family protein [Acidimicrobiales bacterium]
MTTETSLPAQGRADGRVRVAVDIGGTFTDLVAIDPQGRLRRAKSHTTPDALERGVLDVVAAAGVSLGDIGTFVHGSTVVINAITERTGARTGLVTTRGFRDVLEIGRANRPDLYNLRYHKPRPFVPRRLRFEVTERVDYQGNVVASLAHEEVAAVARELERAGVEAVAVSFLHAWVRPDHEAVAADLLRAALPGVSVMASHEVSQQWREYERTSTAVLSAYVQPVVAAYLSALSKGLAGGGGAPRLYAMQSSGGVCSFERAVRAPITMLESGPAAGVSAAADLGRRVGAARVLAFDVGGTTAKVSAVLDGAPPVHTLHHVDRGPVSAGYPVQVPVVDVVEVGTGGGSIAWVDGAGGLHVGPRSAGALPGPACYGLGGRDVTLTDANLLSGRLDPGFFLGGRLALDEGAARSAAARLARRLDVTIDGAVRGVLRLAVAQMANALRLVTLRRGHDPRDFTLVAYGGNGPLHATLLARELGVSRVLVPPGPGHFSAFGMLAGGMAAQAVHTHVAPLDDADLAHLFAPVDAGAQAELGEEPARVSRWVELRYRGQEHSLEVPVPEADDLGDPAVRRALEEEFGRRSEREYALRLDAPLEVVALRVEAASDRPEATWRAATSGDGPARSEGRREVDFDEHGGVLDTPILDRRALVTARWVGGPAVVEEEASTTLVLPGQSVTRDEATNLVVEDGHGR